MLQQGQLGLYLHWPFCLSKCPYCDFNTHIRESIDHDAWLAGYLRSMDHYAAMTTGRALSSIFFGGGTPSLMRPDDVGTIIDHAAKLWGLADGVEITLEANPTSVEMGKFKGFALAGVNRISLGVQALNDRDLAFLGREHNAADAMRAFDLAKAHFGRVSFDLIYARPEQSLADWEAELRVAADLSSDAGGGHLSLYQLTVERNTPFHYDHIQGLFSIPDQDLAADFYDVTQDVLEGLNMPAYEVSNHARVGDESRHNLIYWNYHDYIGIGPGAHGRLTLDNARYATRDHAAPDIWLDLVAKNGCGTHPHGGINERDQVFERLMMGLRLRKGVSISNADWVHLRRGNVETLRDQEWIEFTADHMRLTREGRLRLNAILPFILEDSADGFGE